MIEEEKGYQGWNNYETWAVALWIDNDPDLVQTILDLGEDADDVSMFADNIKELIEDMAPELEVSLFSDLLSSAIGEVDWFELAEAYLRDIAEYKAYEEAK